MKIIFIIVMMLFIKSGIVGSIESNGIAYAQEEKDSFKIFMETMGDIKRKNDEIEGLLFVIKLSWDSLLFIMHGTGISVKGIVNGVNTNTFLLMFIIYGLTK